MNKVCSVCKLEKSSLEFKKPKDDLCLLCKYVLRRKQHCERSKAYYNRNKEAKKEYDKAYYLKTNGLNRLRLHEWRKRQHLRSAKNKVKPIIWAPTEEQLTKTKQLFNDGFGVKSTSKILNISNRKVQKIYSQLGLNNKNRKVQKKKIPDVLSCKICLITKKIDTFVDDKKHYTLKKPYCFSCKEKYGIKACQRAIRNKWQDRELNEHIKIKLKLKEKSSRLWVKNKLKTDPSYKMRGLISGAVKHGLRSRGLTKNGKSIVKYLGYSMTELKEHLEAKFESWMNWNNWGKYNKDLWDDNDASTWTWQIDHIIPHSTFSYKSMTDEAFKKCWSLSNLRPYASKQNLLDGCKRIRHKLLHNDSGNKII